MQKMRDKNTNRVHWITQGGEFNANYTSKIENVLPEIYETITVM